jgi:hypothetical protein
MLNSQPTKIIRDKVKKNSTKKDKKYRFEKNKNQI